MPLTRYVDTTNGRRRELSQLRSYHVDGLHDVSAFKADILKRAVDGIKRVHGKRLKPPRKQVTFDILNVIITPLTNSYDDLSMKTALCVAFAGLLRPQDFTYTSWTPYDQLSKPTRSSLRFHNGYATLHIPYSKTGQERHGTTVHLLQTNTPTCPFTNLKTLFTKYPAPPNAPLFGRHSPVAAFTSTYFTSQHFENSLHSSLLSRANIDPDGFTPHSMRRGGAQSAADAGLTYEQVQTLGRWKGNSALRYVNKSTAARLSAESRTKTRSSSAPR